MEKGKKKNKQTGKKISGKLHLWLGLSSGLVVFIVAITGCLFVFEEEIRNTFQKEKRFVTAVEGTSFISMQQAEAAATAAYPKGKLKQLRVYSERGRAWQAHFDKDMAVTINPYTAAASKPYSRKDWLNTVEEIHTSLLLGKTGKWIIRINVLIFLILLITGIVLWWPGNKARRKQSFKVKWDASGKRVNYDFHNVFGFYSSVILLLIVLTGLYMSFDWMKRATYAITGSEYKKPKPIKIDPSVTGKFSPADAYAAVTTQYPGARETHINYPQKKEDALHIKMHYASSTYKKVNELRFHPKSGEVLQSNLFANYSAGDKIKHSNKELHTGAFFGLFGKILAFVASLIAASMPVTGFAIWWVRSKKKKTTPQKKSVTGYTELQPVIA